MQWTVSGADAGTGQDITLLIDATDEASARSMASGRNFFISSVRPTGPSPTAARSSDLRACANCNSAIGRLEVPRAWNGEPVCDPCFDRLASQQQRGPKPVADYASPRGSGPALQLRGSPYVDHLRWPRARAVAGCSRVQRYSSTCQESQWSTAGLHVCVAALGGVDRPGPGGDRPEGELEGAEHDVGLRTRSRRLPRSCRSTGLICSGIVFSRPSYCSCSPPAQQPIG